MYSISTISSKYNFSQYLRTIELIDSLDDLEECSEDFLNKIRTEKIRMAQDTNKTNVLKRKNTTEKSQQQSSTDSDSEDQEEPSVEPAREERDKNGKKRKKNDSDNPYRGLKDPANPLDSMDDESILKEYKISRKSILDIVEIIEDDVTYLSNRGLPFSPLMHLLITLKHLTSGNTQRHTMSCVSQSTTSRIITKVTGILTKYQNGFIKLPNNNNKQQIKTQFFQYAKFPETVGCIGCFHVGVKVQRFKDDDTFSSTFKNENGYHSLKVQVIIGPNGQIFDINSKCPGSTDENNVFNMSDVNKRQVAQTLQGVFIGNDNYNPTTCIMTNVKNPQTTGDYYYNEALTKTYTIYEDAVSTLKRRFRCLQTYLNCRFATQENLITSCAVIHNIAKSNNDYLLPEDEQRDIVEPVGHKVNAKKIDIRIVDNNALVEREAFITRHFPSYYGNQSSSYLYLE